MHDNHLHSSHLLYFYLLLEMSQAVQTKDIATVSVSAIKPTDFFSLILTIMTVSYCTWETTKHSLMQYRAQILQVEDKSSKVNWATAFNRTGHLGVCESIWVRVSWGRESTSLSSSLCYNAILQSKSVLFCSTFCFNWDCMFKRVKCPNINQHLH